MAFPRIKIRALQAFVAVYEEQSFSRAAKRENTTQSGMSTQVKGLEQVLGAQLLVRERKKFILTPEGEVIYREGQSILKALMKTEQSVREMHSSVGGLVRIGMIPALTRSILIPAFEQFKAEFPSVELSLLEDCVEKLRFWLCTANFFAVQADRLLVARGSAKLVFRYSCASSRRLTNDLI